METITNWTSQKTDYRLQENKKNFFFFFKNHSNSSKVPHCEGIKTFRQNSVMLGSSDRDVGCAGVFGVVAENCISISSMSRSYLLSGCSETKVWMQSVSCK